LFIECAIKRGPKVVDTYTARMANEADRWFAMTNSKRKNQFWVLYFGISMGSKFLGGNGSWGKQFSRWFHREYDD
jgi:hypothetical protein